MSRLTELAVSKRSVTLLLAVALFIAGISAWGSLKQELLPDIALPIITVVAADPGAGASDVADQVSKPIERAISGVPGLDTIQSTSANSLCARGRPVRVRHGRQGDHGDDRPERRGARAPAERRRRKSARWTSTRRRSSSRRSPAAARTGETAAAQVAAAEVVPDLQGLDGVASVDLAGGLTSRLVVTLDPTKMAAAGVSIDQVEGVLTANNLTLPAGQLSTDGTQIPVSTSGSFTTVGQISGLVVGSSRIGRSVGSTSGRAGLRVAGSRRRQRDPARAAGGHRGSGRPLPRRPPRRPPPSPTLIHIADIGSVAIAQVATTGYARTNGEPSLTITVSKNANANTVDVADAVQAKLAQIAAQPSGAQDRHGLRSLDVHQGIAGRPAPRGWAGRPVRGDHDLPVPVQPPLDARGGRQHPTVRADRARGDAGDRDHPEHHDPGRPGGGGGPGRRRRDRGAREHLPAPRDGRGPPDSRAQGPPRGGRRDHERAP